MSDYDRIASAIAYLQANITAQPQLVEVARHVHLSPFHFQRLFTRWAGTTPKRFLQVLTLELGKNLLSQEQSLLDIADELGLSSSSRLHDHFVQIEAVTPGEFRSKGEGLTIEYGAQATPFGDLFVAQTPRGICRAAFIDSSASLAEQLSTLQKTWPRALYSANDTAARKVAAVIAELSPKFSPTLDYTPVITSTNTSTLTSTLTSTSAQPNAPLTLHISGTNFQLAVWRALLRIPSGTAVSYAAIAEHIGSPRAVRAAGTAIGANPVALLIPCHRVIQQSGALGGYRWGLNRKLAIQTWEVLKQQPAEVTEPLTLALE